MHFNDRHRPKTKTLAGVGVVDDDDDGSGGKIAKILHSSRHFYFFQPLFSFRFIFPPSTTMTPTHKKTMTTTATRITH